MILKIDIKTRSKKTNAPCLEKERSSISPDYVEKYISAIERIMQDPSLPSLILNFDETVFSKRPEKGLKKAKFEKCS